MSAVLLKTLNNRSALLTAIGVTPDYYRFQVFGAKGWIELRDDTRFTFQPLDGAARKLDLGNVNPGGSFWIDASISNDGALAFTGSEPHRPVELYYLASPTAKPKRLTDFKSSLLFVFIGHFGVGDPGHGNSRRKSATTRRKSGWSVGSPPVRLK